MNHRPPQWAAGVTGIVLAVILVSAYFPSMSNHLVPLGLISPAGVPHLWTLPGAYPAVGGTMSTTLSLGGVLIAVYAGLRWVSGVHQDEADRPDQPPSPGAPPVSPPAAPPAPPAASPPGPAGIENPGTPPPVVPPGT